MSDLRIFTASDCARRYQISVSEWRKLVSNREAPTPTQVGRKKLWTIDTLIQWEESVVAQLDEQQQLQTAG